VRFGIKQFLSAENFAKRPTKAVLSNRKWNRQIHRDLFNEVIAHFLERTIFAIQRGHVADTLTSQMSGKNGAFIVTQARGVDIGGGNGQLGIEP
jgi:hypothetical protein